MASKAKETSVKPKQRLKNPQKGSDSDDEHDQQRKKRRSKTVKDTEPTTSKHQSRSARKAPSDSDSGSDSDEEHDQQRKKRRSKTVKDTEPTTSKHQSRSARKAPSDSDSGTKKEPTSSDKDKESSSSTSDDSNTENIKYVYRLLRPDEQFSDGIYPKDINSKISILDHVLHGSHTNQKTKYISCCKTMEGIRKIVENHRLDHCPRTVVKINVQNLEEVNVIDLTTPTAISQHLKFDFTAQRFSRMYEEIILEPNNCIPGDCVEEVTTVRDRELLH